MAEDGPSEHEQTHLPASTDPEFRMVLDTAVEDTVSPPRESRSSDATQLSVPILIVIAMLVSGVTAAISASGVYWMLRLSNQEAQYQMQSDIRDIRRLMENDKIIQGKDAEILDGRFKILESMIKEQTAKAAAMSSLSSDNRAFQNEVLKRR